jgi:hypothetical protein
VAELRKIPGVRHIGSQAGRAVFSDRGVDVDSSELWVKLDQSADYEDTLARCGRWSRATRASPGR